MQPIFLILKRKIFFEFHSPFYTLKNKNIPVAVCTLEPSNHAQISLSKTNKANSPILAASVKKSPF